MLRKIDLMKSTSTAYWHQIQSAIIATFIASAIFVEAGDLPLVPYPQKVELKEGTFTPSIALNVVYAPEGGIKEIADVLLSDLNESGFKTTPEGAQPDPSSQKIELILRKEPNFGEEGYELRIDKNVSITASSPDGLFWGTRTLLQLLHAGPGKSISHCKISDRPEFAYRGLLIDNARNFHSIDFHLQMVKRLASFKINRYQIHFSDHESYTLPSELFPKLPTEGRHYTKADIARLVEVAKRYHVAIVPEIDVPGHAVALLKGIEGLGCDVGTGKICIGQESSYQSLEKLFSEVMEMIPGDYWHLGADEVSYSGTRCKGCLARMESEHFKDEDQLFHYFINRMSRFLKSRDRQVLVWEGFSPTAEPLVDRDILVCPFDVKKVGKMPVDYLKAGYTLLNTSWSPLYVADKTSMTTPEDLARWSPYMFGAGRSPHPFQYWKKFNPIDYPQKIIGAQVCSWDIEEKAQEGLLFGTGSGFPDYGRPAPRVPIVAERTWTGSATSAQDLMERVGSSYWE